MSYYIKVVINGKEDRLNKVGPPTFLMAETYDFVRKSMLILMFVVILEI